MKPQAPQVCHMFAHGVSTRGNSTVLVDFGVGDELKINASLAVSMSAAL